MEQLIEGRRRRSVRLLPSIVTILALCSGMSAVKFALEGDVGPALALVAAAAVLDTLDGRLARLLAATTKIGAELDSLADAISFGVAPALVLFVSLLRQEHGSAGWIVALLFAVSIVLRLARFNTLMDDDTRPEWERDYFVGVPAPAAALLAMAPIALVLQFGRGWWSSFPIVGGWVLVAAGLSVSTIPTLALKSVSVAPQAAAALLALVALGAAALVTYPVLLLLVLIALYLGHIPFAWYSQHWVATRPEAWQSKPAERRAQRRADRRSGVARRPVLPRPDIRRPTLRGNSRLWLRRPSKRERDKDTYSSIDG